MATAEMLSTLDDETQIRILAGTLHNGMLTNAQKEEILHVNKKALHTFTIQTNVKKFVAENPNFLLDYVW